jgi:guanidinopropionase
MCRDFKPFSPRNDIFMRSLWDSAVESEGTEDFFARGVAEVMGEAREVVGEGETCVSYGIDFVDSAFASGMGTSVVGGPNSLQALEVVRDLQGVKTLPVDFVEVAPPFDPLASTAWVSVSILFAVHCATA